MGSGSARLVIARGAPSPHGHGPLLVMRMALVFVLLLLLGASVNVVNAESVANIVSRSFFDGILNAPTPTLANCGCAIGSCCSRWGYCGTTSDYCGDGCQSGPCTSSGGGSPTTGGGNVGTIISQSIFDGLAGGAASSCEGKGCYTYDDFIAAANAYFGFGNTGSSDDQKRELAAFFANVMHETGGLCYINEQNPPMIYCDIAASTSSPCTSGKSYHGRGPLQLSWNYNYLVAGRNIGFDGLNNPDVVAQDATISFKTAVWFWMQNCDSAITSGQGFGATIKAINSMECNGGNTPAAQLITTTQYVASWVSIPEPMSPAKSLFFSWLPNISIRCQRCPWLSS